MRSSYVREFDFSFFRFMKFNPAFDILFHVVLLQLFMTPFPALWITFSLVRMVIGFSSNDDFKHLLVDIESEEVRKGLPSRNTPAILADMTRFRSLVERSHVKRADHSSLPVCLGDKQNDPSFTKYEGHCSFTLTASEYCCSVYAEQACMDPAVALRQSLTVVQDRIAGLDGAANSFLYDKCMLDNCSSACSVSEGNDVHCKQCATVCQRSCLANLSLLCQRRVCGQNLLSVAEGAMSMDKQSTVQDPSHEWTTNIVQKQLSVSNQPLMDVERHDVVEFILGLLDPSVSVPMCRDPELVSADRAAGVFIDQSGRTYSDALLKCTQNTLAPGKLSALIADPHILKTDDDCGVVARCERDHVRMAEDRGSAQLKVLKARVSTSESTHVNA